ncbi:MAG: uncharacterized membrane protein YjfL (UPF0719 family) [Psychromonas sp.]|jgi:uncharacterized membrane protein YjfL (UPF0719 family)
MDKFLAFISPFGLKKIFFILYFAIFAFLTPFSINS